ncbi:MAG: YraN family protein [Pseudohongiella sp.]|nr:YraN family protein [Pseudohongiella sp.]MDO9520866.1 YraN family protein [Pseudohongiella sp.]MDP2128071.1 YraN family protein [Pseudohongiella sp.]
MSYWKTASNQNPRAIAPAHRRHSGNAYEQLAADYLRSQGLDLISSNYQCKLGEIDLIMKHREMLVFVEVRYRLNSDFMSPIVSINSRKQNKLIRTAQVYLKQHHLTDAVPCRIDVVGITPLGGSYRFEWIPNAIQPGI